MTATPHTTGKIDARWHTALAQFTAGLSPAALATAYLDWSLHLMASPERQAALARFWFEEPMAEEIADPRFAAPEWQKFPFNIMAQNFLSAHRWWDAATCKIPGVDPKHASIVNFAGRQLLDMWSPVNSAFLNPVVRSRTIEEHGTNLVRGARYWIDDFNRMLAGHPRRESQFKVGKDLAITPGDVILRNRLIELIRYHPTTSKVHPEPILIVPAWIMKYYVLDLTETRSLVAFLRDQGFEVYVISWKNPRAEDADLAMQDYLDLGVRAAVDHLTKAGAQQIHAVGYCLGGTLMAIAAAAMARDGHDVLRSLTLLAAQVDFSEPGELGLFINESQVAFLEDMMATQGYLKADQMAGAFQLLRSNDLIWSRVVRHYLLGERTPDNPLMAWNADATRMPARMHSEYLRRMFLGNDLAKGRFTVDDETIALTDIRCPIYCVATETDHVSPWTSVYRLLLLTDTDVSFVLCNGGHNGGILSEPGREGRPFRAGEKREGAPHIASGDWYARHTLEDGSWWVHWAHWLHAKSGDQIDRRSSQFKPLAPAPGSYVFG
ncbi:polyhydroxyalkanoate synthase [Cognatiyoonia koreensis]|uniref:Polyhydroxyalkanoate synthase n=1 Tax=Cognatiyoonia koreensis TaxID=364200 RepID=A0A1I0QHM0_9RHOB|nr:alpha/beta fold hydrolase [Cognatiyoonia koreensis]SEW26492.1 polyhydroxyalkanoate synthase [Cognatiyoonia koreensis]